ncbi:TonB-dependent receptor [Sphingomonas sp. PAMC 26605]|uniref:TonB-dependent receptor n=1 Tax=Sphingomonas sp. PAMC 26605 TaxID=1112214 RepID=UPI00026CB5F3|nr:TonB-dependent receptor [Sphingomonas sp. PAMC 26605]
MTGSNKLRLMVAASGTTLAMVAVPVLAQDAPPVRPAMQSDPAAPAAPLAQGPATSADAASANATPGQQGLADIIVTAQRRSENLQRAAVAVSVVQGADLVAAGITQPGRLGELAPALTIQPSSTGNLIFLRGVGNFTLTPNSDPAIAFNYDGVYIGRPTSTNGLFYDLDRIEVLKGPQGTLYGRNATGGAINLIPAQPKLGDLSGYLTASYGDYNAVVAEGAINLPLGETGALRVSASTSRHDGYLSDGTSDDNTTSLRVQMKVKLTPALTVRLAGDYSHVGGIGAGVSYISNYSYNPVAGRYATVLSGLTLADGLYTPAAQAYRTTITAGPSGRKEDAIAPYPFQRNNFYGANAQIDYDTGAGTLTIIPAWRYASLNYLAEAAAFPYRNREKDEQFSIEARFTGNRIGIFDYTLGGYYYDETIRNRTALNLSAAENFLIQNYRTRSFAPFGRLTAHLTERLRVIGGVRYSKDIKSFVGNTTALNLVCVVRVAGVPTCPNAHLFTTVDTLSQVPFAVPSGPAPIPQGASGAIVVRTDSTFNDRLTNDRVTYHGGVEFDLAPRSLLYATVESGYRSGGFSAAQGFETYQPETITAYTVGLKNRFFDNRVQLNVEGFLWDYNNQQVSHLGLDLSGRTAQFIQNIGKSQIKGVEVEGRVLVTKTTLVSADVQYLDARDRSFAYQQGSATGAPLTGCAYAIAANPAFYNVNCAGKQGYNSPRWTLNMAAQQSFNVGLYKVVAGVDTQYKTSRTVGFEYLPEQLVGSTWMTNAQVSFGPASDRWSIAGFVRNIEDSRILNFAVTHPLANTLVGGSTAPRTYGARASVKF